MTESEPPNPDVLSNPGPNVLPTGFDLQKYAMPPTGSFAEPLAWNPVKGIPFEKTELDFPPLFSNSKDPPKIEPILGYPFSAFF